MQHLQYDVLCARQTHCLHHTYMCARQPCWHAMCMCCNAATHVLVRTKYLHIHRFCATRVRGRALSKVWPTCTKPKQRYKQVLQCSIQVRTINTWPRHTAWHATKATTMHTLQLTQAELDWVLAQIDAAFVKGDTAARLQMLLDLQDQAENSIASD